MLTPYGREAATRVGIWEGHMLAEGRLLQAPTHHGPGDIFAWANGALRQSTDTDNAMLRGMFPDCGDKVGSNKVTGPNCLSLPRRLTSDAPSRTGMRSHSRHHGRKSGKSAVRVATLLADLQSMRACCMLQLEGVREGHLFLHVY